MIVVPYSAGSATPSQIALAAATRGDECVFVLDPDDVEAVGHAAILRQFGMVIETNNLVEIIAKLPRRPKGVVAFSERSLTVSATLTDHFGLPGHPAATVRRLMDKAAQRDCLNAKGVGYVPTVSVISGGPLPDYLPLPGVLKPRAGAGSRDTFFVDNLLDLMTALHGLDPSEPYVIEQRLVGAEAPLGDWLADYISVETAVADGQVAHLGVTGRLPLAAPARETGLIFPIALPDGLASSVLGLTSAAIDVLEIRNGLCHTEIKLTPKGPEIIEVNARLGGGLASIMPRAGFIDPVLLAIDLACGCGLPELPTPTRAAVHLYVQPPQAAIGLATAPEPRRLRGLPGVYGADCRVQPGGPVNWRSGSAGRIYDIWIVADSLDELRRHLADVCEYIDQNTGWVYP